MIWRALLHWPSDRTFVWFSPVSLTFPTSNPCVTLFCLHLSKTSCFQSSLLIPRLLLFCYAFWVTLLTYTVLPIAYMLMNPKSLPSFLTFLPTNLRCTAQCLLGFSACMFHHRYVYLKTSQTKYLIAPLASPALLLFPFSLCHYSITVQQPG